MIEKLIDLIIERRKADLQSRIQRYPRTIPIASDIPDCDRYIVHSILDWKDRPLHNEGLQAIFDAGNDEEKKVQIILLGLNIDVIETQTPFEIKNRLSEVICRGKIDGKIRYENKIYPFEIKSMNMNTFNLINSLEDFQKRPLLRKYLRQMQLYLFGHNAEEGMFILSNLQGHLKLIPVYLDYGECEYILGRIERVWECIKKKEYPAQIDYNEKICGRCAFAHLCLPEVKHEGINIIDNPELEERLSRREELKPLVDEYENIDDEVKSTFREIPETIIGTSWRIISEKREQKFLNTKIIPDEIRKKFEEIREVVKVKIIKLGEIKKDVPF